jgi:hypothetical protein
MSSSIMSAGQPASVNYGADATRYPVREWELQTQVAIDLLDAAHVAYPNIPIEGAPARAVLRCVSTKLEELVDQLHTAADAASAEAPNPHLVLAKAASGRQPNEEAAGEAFDDQILFGAAAEHVYDVFDLLDVMQKASKSAGPLRLDAAIEAAVRKLYDLVNVLE